MQRIPCPDSDSTGEPNEKHEPNLSHKTSGLKFVPLDEESLRRNDTEQRRSREAEWKLRIRVHDSRKAK